MTNRDDMVMTVRLRQRTRSIKERVRRDRRISISARRERGLMTRAAHAKAAHSMRRMAKRKPTRGRSVKTGSAVFRVAARAVAGPIGALAGLAGLAALRIGTGRSLENVSANVSHFFMGDKAPAQAAAEREVRNRLMQSEFHAGIAAGDPKQLLDLFNADVNKLTLTKIGKRKIDRDIRFQNDSTFELIVMRAWTAMKNSFLASGGISGSEALRERTQNHPKGRR